MRPPKDPFSYETHVTSEDSKIKIWCVECERWSDVVIIASAIVTYRQNHWPNKSEEAHSPGYHCGTRGCWADVEYLLSEANKKMILDLAGVPIPRRSHACTRSPQRVMQIRMEI